MRLDPAPGTSRQSSDDAPAATGNAPRGERLRLAALSGSIGALLALVAAAAVFLWLGGNRNPDLPVIGEAPHYRLINQNGKPVSSAQFAGKVRVVAALFPYCTELCPLVAANLAEFDANVVQRSDLKGHVVFVFFNVAPGDAGPPELRAFLKQYGWSPDDPAVQFLTGPPPAIERVVRGGYHIAYYRTQGEDDGKPSPIEIANPLADRVKPDFDIKHDDIIEVVDGLGRIRKIFTSGARLDDVRLHAAIAPLLGDGAS
jgi:cytochrome oxidase Cu insertion factor (SCO1/SenC/PrrC family)